MYKNTTYSELGLKKVLLVGINYIEDPNNRLNGCINDVNNIKFQINKYYPKCLQFRVLTDDSISILNKPTRKNIIDCINWLVSDLKPGENVLFHFSGHGGLTKDTNGDEISGSDSCIYPICKNNIEMILDDELRILLANKIPKGSKCFAILDCCHSGSGIDLRYNMQCPVYGSVTISQNDKQNKTEGSVILLSGCMDTQTSADTVNFKGQPSGALTNALIDIWNTYGTNIKLKHLLWNLRKLLKERGYEQIPQLSCGNHLDIDSVFSLDSAKKLSSIFDKSLDIV
jgi:hypothetical protein